MIYRYLRAFGLFKNNATLSCSLKLLVKSLFFFRLMIFRRGCPESISISGTGVFIIYYSKVVIYIPLFKSHEMALGHSYSIHCRMRSNAKGLFFYSMRKFNFYNTSYYMVSKLTFPDSFAVEYSDIKSRIPVVGKFIGKLVDFESLSWVNYDFGWPLMNQYRDRLLNCTIESNIGFVHGDLHYGNIMSTKSGGCVLIDLDKASLCALQLYDDMHFKIERYVFQYSKDWIYALGKHVDSCAFSSMQIGFYIINRIYLESMYGARSYPRFKRRIELILFKISEDIHLTAV